MELALPSRLLIIALLLPCCVLPASPHLGQKSHRRHLNSRSEPYAPVCPTNMTSCATLGRPEICCPQTSTCLRTTNALTGVYCCHATPCFDTHLRCPASTFPCPASVDGGCCPWGSLCARTECVLDRGGPGAPVDDGGRDAADVAAVDVDGDGLSGAQDPVEEMPRTGGQRWRSSEPEITPAPYASFTVKGGRERPTPMPTSGLGEGLKGSAGWWLWGVGLGVAWWV